jgi:hypothetical protein
VLNSVDASAGSGAFAAAAFIQQSGNDTTTNRVVAAVVDLPQHRPAAAIHLRLTT